MPSVPNSPRWLRPTLLALFVVSGFAGLIYQSLWAQYLGLFLGHAAYAQALVLALFMGGMAIGAWLVAAVGERWRNLVRGYALVELVIGVLGLLFHTVFVTVLGWSYSTVIPALGGGLPADLYRWGLAAALILPQSVLLGMTFPLMSGGVIRRFPGAEGSVLGGLYFTNSIGAAFGALAATFLLVPRVGLPGAILTAAILNVLVGLAAWLLARAPEPPPRLRIDATAVSPSEPAQAEPPRLLLLVLGGTALSGAASFVYEIVWVRMLSLAVGSTMHAFELMLAAFIAGIAFGGLWIRRRADRTREPLRLVGWMQIWMGVTALGSLLMYANAFSWVGFLMESLSRSDGGYTLFNFGTAAIAIAIMLPSAFFAGTTLPLFTMALLRAGYGEAAIGRVYAWNTLGAIVGVFAAIHVLIPLLGLKLALTAAALVDLSIGLVLLRLCTTDRLGMLRFASAGLVSASALAIAVLGADFNPLRLAAGVYRHGVIELSPNHQVLFYRDGKTSSVSVVANPDGTVSIATNGKVDASIAMQPGRAPSIDEPTMVLAAALPLAFQREPRNAAVIGFGSGLTTHALLADRRFERVDTIEIEQAMVDGARLFGARVARAYSDPRSNIVIDDAKSFFAGQRTRYDVIVSEPSNPWISGVGALFSREFYEFIPAHLSEEGIFVQWVQLYEISDELVGSILAAFTPVFSDYAAYLTNHADLLILAKPHGRLGTADYAGLLAGELGPELAYLGFTRPEQLGLRRIADARLLRAVDAIQAQPPNSDYFPRLGLDAPRARFRGQMATQLALLPILEFPLLETLDIRQPLPLDVATGDPETFSADRLTREARRLTAALTAPPAGTHESSERAQRQAFELRAIASDCAALATAAGEEAFVLRLGQWLAELLPYLPAEELHPVFVEPNWIGCAQLPERLAQAMALAAALSERDAARVTERASAWLDALPEDPRSGRLFDQLAFVGLLAAEFRLGAGEADLAALDAHYGGRLQAHPTLTPASVLLRAYADQ